MEKRALCDVNALFADVYDGYSLSSMIGRLRVGPEGTTGMDGIRATKQGGAQPSAARTPRSRRPRPHGRRGRRGWSVPRRLLALAVLAVLVDLTVGGLRVAANVESGRAFGRVTQLAVLGQRVTGLAQALEDERDQSAAFIASGRPSGGADAVDNAQSSTDEAATQVTDAAKSIGAAYPAATRAKVTAVLNWIADLPGLRQAAVGTELPSLTATMDYSAAIVDLLSLNDEIAQEGAAPAGAAEVTALSDLSRLEEAASRQRALLVAAFTEHFFEPRALTDLVTAQSAEGAYSQAFQATATSALQEAFNDQVVGPQVDEAQLIEERVIATGSLQTDGLDLPAGSPPAQWYAAMTRTLNPIRAIEGKLTGSIIAQSQALQAGPRRSAILTIGLTAAVLLFVLAVTVIIARSLVLPLGRLEAGALRAAAVPQAGDDQALPGADAAGRPDGYVAVAPWPAAAPGLPLPVPPPAGTPATSGPSALGPSALAPPVRGEAGPPARARRAGRHAATAPQPRSPE
jgi:hypothetical protein